MIRCRSARRRSRTSPRHALPDVRHQVTEGAQFPSLVKTVEALRHAVIRRRDLIRVDGIELFARDLWVPEDQGSPANELSVAGRDVDRGNVWHRKGRVLRLRM